MITNKKILVEALNTIAVIEEDPSERKRGWYICVGGNGTLYLDKRGVITHGVDGFWDTKKDAANFLNAWENT